VIHFTSPAGWLPIHRDQLRVQRSVIAKFHYTDTDTDFFAAKLRWVRAGPCRARVRVRVVEFSYNEYGKTLPFFTSFQTDNHTSTLPLSFLQAGCPSCRPTNSVKALKAKY